MFQQMKVAIDKYRSQATKRFTIGLSFWQQGQQSIKIAEVISHLLTKSDLFSHSCYLRCWF